MKPTFFRYLFCDLVVGNLEGCVYNCDNNACVIFEFINDLVGNGIIDLAEVRAVLVVELVFLVISIKRRVELIGRACDEACKLCVEIVFDLENLISVSNPTHNAIHFGDESLLPIAPPERIAGDTKLW